MIWGLWEGDLEWRALVKQLKECQATRVDYEDFVRKYRQEGLEVGPEEEKAIRAAFKEAGVNFED